MFKSGRLLELYWLKIRLALCLGLNGGGDVRTQMYVRGYKVGYGQIRGTGIEPYSTLSIQTQYHSPPHINLYLQFDAEESS